MIERKKNLEEQEVKRVPINIRRKCKTIAKDRILRNLLWVMVAVLICMLPLMMAANVAYSYMLMTGNVALALLLCAAVLVLLVLPLIYGLMHYLMDVLFYHRSSLLTVFDALGSRYNYVRSLKLGLCVALRSALWMSIPVALTVGYCYLALTRDPSIVQDAEKFYALAGQLSIFYLLVSTPFAGRILRYVGAYFLAVRTPDMRIREAIKTSVRLFRRQGVKLTVLVLSFLGWQLFGIWTMGIGTLFYWGYLFSTMIAYTWYMEHPEKQTEPPADQPGDN